MYMAEKRLNIVIAAKDLATGVAGKIGGAFKNLTAPARAAAGAISKIGDAGAGLLGKLGQLAGIGMIVDRLGRVAQFAFGQMTQNSKLLGAEMTRLQVVTNSLWSALGDRLAPAVRAVTSGLAGLAGQGTQAGATLESGLGARISQLAQNALTWGANVAAEFAGGIVQGAATFLTQAMDFIGNLLTSWLSPGSPPKVAPDIDQWGAAAMNSFIGGFSEANFGALSGLQGSLQTALGAMVNLGDIGKEAAGGLFKQLSLDMAGAMEEFDRTGAVGGAVFDKLASLGGVFGDKLANLARSQFDLTAATRALEAAQERLNAARNKEDTTLSRVKALKNEYFALRRAGGSKEQVAAKLAEIKAAQSGLRAARDERAAAEQAQAAAQAKIDPLQKQVSIQEQLIAQLARMADAQEKAGAGAAGGIAGALTKGLGGVSETLKKGFGDVFGKIFEPFKEAYETKMKPALDALAAKWDWFKGIVKAFIDDPRVQAVIEWIKGLFPPGTAENAGKLVGWFAALAVVGILLVGALALLFSPIVLLGIGIAILASLWAKHGDEIKRIALMLAAIILKMVLDMIAFITRGWEAWKFVWDAIVLVASTAWDAIVAKFSEGTTAWQGIWDNIALIATTTWDNISTGLGNGVSAWVGIFENAKLLFSTVWADIVKVITTALSIDWAAVGGGIISGIAGGITGAAASLGNAAAQAAKDALAAAKKALGIQSPSKVAAKQIGLPFMQGIAQGISRSRALAGNALTGTLNSLVAGAGATRSPAMAGAAAGGGNVTVVVQGNVLDDRMAQRIADQVERAKRMKGVRRF
jgi:hypothetical protein